MVTPRLPHPFAVELYAPAASEPDLIDVGAFARVVEDEAGTMVAWNSLDRVHIFSMAGDPVRDGAAWWFGLQGHHAWDRVRVRRLIDEGASWLSFNGLRRPREDVAAAAARLWP